MASCMATFTVAAADDLTVVDCPGDPMLPVYGWRRRHPRRLQRLGGRFGYDGGGVT